MKFHPSIDQCESNDYNNKNWAACYKTQNGNILPFVPLQFHKKHNMHKFLILTCNKYYSN